MRVQASSVANISSSMQSFSQFGYISARSSFEELKQSYSTQETQNQVELPTGQTRHSEVGHPSNLQTGIMIPKTPSLSPGQQEGQLQGRRYSTSTDDQTQVAPPQEGSQSHHWLTDRLLDEAPLPGFHMQEEHRRRREVQSMTPSSLAAVPRQSDSASQGLFHPVSFTDPTASQDNFPYRPMPPIPAYAGEGRRPSYHFQATPPNLSEGGFSSGTQSYTRSPGYPSYYSPPQQ